MEDYRTAKQALHGIPSERKNQGRPRFIWKDTVWRDIEPIDTS